MQTANCPECGAAQAACEARFHEFLSLEFSDAGYGAVHHLTVATYMLQHSSQLTREGWLEMRRLLREFLVAGKSPVEVRARNGPDVDSGNRKWKIKAKDGLPKIGKTRWAKTICDVRTETAETYCADVVAWARSALEEAELIEVGQEGPK
jgi:hypothetical protein